MINKIKNNKKLIITYFFTVILLFVFSFLFVNGNLLKHKENRGVFSLDENVIVSKSKKSTTIEYDGERYIDKFHFSYKSNKNINIKYKVTYYNKFGRITKKTIEARNSYLTNDAYQKIGKNVRKITMKIDKNIDVYNFSTVNEIHINWYIFIFLSILFLNIYLFYFKRCYFSKKIEKGFLVIALSAGILFIICEPVFPNSSWDDQIHYNNIYKMGTTDTKYSVITKNVSDLELVKDMFDTLDERNNFYDKVDKLNDKTTKYPIGPKYSSFKKLNYIPISIIYLVSDILNLSYVVTFILGKLLYLLLYVTVIYFAIKIIPKHKHLVALIGLIPTSLFMASNYNYDNFIISFSLFFIAVFVKEMSNKTKLINKKLLIISLLGLIIGCFTKAVYAPLLLILLLLPKTKFSSLKNYRIFRLGVISLTFILCATFVLPTISSPSEISDVRGGDTSAKRQIKSIINSPISFTKSFSGNYFINFSDKFIGRKTLTNYSYYENTEVEDVSNNYYILIVILVFFTLVENIDKEYLNKKDKLFILAVIMLVMAFIWGALYLSFTPVGGEIIKGVQGRYFIPLLLPLLLLFKTDKINHKIDEITYSSILYYGMIFVLFVSIFSKIVLNYCL